MKNKIILIGVLIISLLVLSWISPILWNHGSSFAIQFLFSLWAVIGWLLLIAFKFGWK